MNELYTSAPALGQRVGFQNADGVWTRGVVVEIKQQVVRDTQTISTYVIGLDGNARIEAPATTRFTLLGTVAAELHKGVYHSRSAAAPQH